MTHMHALYSFYDYFEGVKRASADSLAWSVGRSVDPSLGRKLLFVFPLTNAQLDLTKRKISSKGVGKCET